MARVFSPKNFSILCPVTDRNLELCKKIIIIIHDLLSLQFRLDFSVLHKQILITIGSCFPEVCAFSTFITSTEVFKV